MQKKLSVSLEEKLIDRIDKFAADSGLNCPRSSLSPVFSTWMPVKLRPV